LASYNIFKQIAEAEAGLQPPVIKVGNLSAMRDFTDVRDIVRAYSLLIQKGRAGEVYNVGSGKALTMREVLDIVLSLAKIKITVEQDSNLMRVSDTPVIQADISRLKRETGYPPARYNCRYAGRLAAKARMLLKGSIDL
jgi:GDP-4-dehydro-6-deoxy-D-mannose reductase